MQNEWILNEVISILYQSLNCQPSSRKLLEESFVVCTEVLGFRNSKTSLSFVQCLLFTNDSLSRLNLMMEMMNMPNVGVKIYSEPTQMINRILIQAYTLISL